MRKGFGFHDRHSPFRFNPATLFIGGAIEGAFYDSSNITTLFQDDAGTTPVTAVEQTVGRILDLSGNANHATQSVASSRPTYRARYNMLERSEEFDNGYWRTANNVTITANQSIAPDGTLTADLMTEVATTATHRIVANNDAAVTGSLVSQTYVFSAYYKPNTGSPFALLYMTDGSGANQVRAWFNLTTGVKASQQTVGAGVVVSWTMEPAANGFYRCTLVASVGAGTLGVYAHIAMANADLSLSYLGNTGRSVFIWGGQFINTTDNSPTGNAYQRVAAATSYDTSNPVWRPYLALDGSNDSMLTGSIDFTATNKMSVWAGVTKGSDAAQGVVAELSADIASNNGAFLLSAPNSAAANYNWSSKGTTQVNNTVTTYTAPNTAVLTGQADIAAPSNIIRVNGAQAGSVATTQGTGNFGNYPLYIGRRNNATVPFNGRLYGLIVLGAAASSWQVFAAERWMAGKTGISI